MRPILLLLIAAATACGGSGGGDSIQDRCDTFCARRNMDPNCGAAVNCAATCANVVTEAQRCDAEVSAFLTCTANASSVCVPGGQLWCMTENTSIIYCQADAGP